MENQIFKLKNNIEVFYKHNKNTPRTALCFNLSLNKPEKSAGIYTLMARLFMQGTKTRTAEQLANEFEAYAIEFSSELKQDYLRFRFLCLNEDFSKALELMTDVIKNSTFEEFDKERIKLKGEIIAELDSPRVKVSDAFYKTIFANHPYGTSYTKIFENLDNITKQDVIEAAKEIFHNSKKIISVIGELPFERVNSELDNALGDIENSLDEKNIPLIEPLSEPKNIEIIKSDANQAHILKGWIMPSYEHEDYPALALLNTILGSSGLSSRLFLELRDKKGLAYVVRSSYEPLGMCGTFYIYIATEPKNIDVCMEGFKEEIDKIRLVKVSEEELENAKNTIFGRWTCLQETNMQLASLYSHHAVLGLGFYFNADARDRIKKVSVEDIQACAQKYFTENAVVSLLKP